MNFYQRLMDTLQGIWNDAVQAAIYTFKWFEALYKIHAWAMGVFIGLLLFVFTYVFDAVTWIAERVPALMAALTTGGGLTGQGVQIPEPFREGFALFNSFFPITELVGFAIFLMPFWLVAVTIRTIKSWIPTVS